MNNKIGEQFITNLCGLCYVINYKGKSLYSVIFEDGTIVENVKLSTLKLGQVKNPNTPLIHNKGYFGVGNHKAKCKKYSLWSSVLNRCYSKEFHKKEVTYIDCSISEKWCNYQNFGDWFEENYIEGWHLDKDILFKGNKVYSPETCCFVPQEINNLFISRKNNRGDLPIGVRHQKFGYVARINKYKKSIYLGTFATAKLAFEAYKITKEDYIKELANKYKEQLTNKVFNKLMTYKVEINS